MSKLKRDHPLCVGMREVIRSDEGRAACIQATDDGWPAMAGVDPLLAGKFGADYGKRNMSTHWAGRFVSEVMSEAGYRQVGKLVH